MLPPLRHLLVALLAVPMLARPSSGQLPAPPVVAGSSFEFGAYGAITVTSPEHPEEVERPAISELVAALMAWGRISGRASYLVEVDMAKQTTATWTGRESDERLAPVRMYLEFAAADLLRVRAGRFLTPFGRWNEYHAEPLTWTPTRPLTTYRPFAKSLTGIMLAGEASPGGIETGYALFWSPFPAWNEAFQEAEESAFGQVLGGRIASEVHANLTLGLSLAVVQREVPEVESDQESEPGEVEDHGRPLVGADIAWSGANLDLSAESSFLPTGRGLPREAGIYLQGAFRLWSQVWAVGRAEYYEPVDGRPVRTGYAGLTIRESRHFVVKLGRQFSRHPSEKLPGGWFLSLSSLF